MIQVLSDILDSLFEILDLKKPSLEKPVFKVLVSDVYLGFYAAVQNKAVFIVNWYFTAWA